MSEPEYPSAPPAGGPHDTATAVRVEEPTAVHAAPADPGPRPLPPPEDRDPASVWWTPPDATHGGRGGWGPPEASSWWGSPPRPSSGPHLPRIRPARAVLQGVLMIVLVASGVGIGVRLGGTRTSPGTSSATSVPGSASTSPSAPGSSGSSSSAANVSQLAAQVDPAVVDVNTQLGYRGGAAAGTGIVLTSSGEVLTNNHVVAGATSVSVTDVGNGRTYSATVVGTDATDDIAVLKLSGASGLVTFHLGSSSTVSVGDAVVAVGNAGGQGGTPSAAGGTVTALGQSITATDASAGSSEQLTGLIQTDATLQPGDSGGPLVDSSGKVIGIDTAASSDFQFQAGSSQSFAIPVDRAMTVARSIESGHGSSTVHIGPSAFLGIEVGPASSAGAANGSGAAVIGVLSGTPAEHAGLAQGDRITSVDGQPIDTPATLSSVLAQHHPGDTVPMGWTDSSGHEHSAQVQLATGPAA